VPSSSKHTVLWGAGPRARCGSDGQEFPLPERTQTAIIGQKRGLEAGRQKDEYLVEPRDPAQGLPEAAEVFGGPRRQALAPQTAKKGDALLQTLRGPHKTSLLDLGSGRWPGVIARYWSRRSRHGATGIHPALKTRHGKAAVRKHSLGNDAESRPATRTQKALDLGLIAARGVRAATIASVPVKPLLAQAARAIPRRARAIGT